MSYMSIRDAANKWNVSYQTVLNFCNSGRLSDAKKIGNHWIIPENAVYPVKDKDKNQKKFTFIDLFCGVGGFNQAMTALGGKCVFACDINSNCRDVYINNFCKYELFPVYGDIIKAIEDGVIPEFDVLCGGFPCQPFSKAGLQGGFEIIEKENGDKDERGQLFYRIIDILKEHPECKYIVLENVRNLADKKDNWYIVCEELKKQGFIITEDPIIASPHSFGIPQVRERVFILGIRKEVIDKRRKLPEGYLSKELLHIDTYKKTITDDYNCLPDVLDKGVDKKYLVPDEIQTILDIWEEFRANIVGLASPFWIHKAGIGIYDREDYYNDPQIGFKEMPEWKKKLVLKSRVMYENNHDFIDEWIDKYDMTSRIMLHQKFEWNCGNDCQTMRDGIIQIRQSGIRVKRPNYFPSLVVMKNTPIVWDMDYQHYRFITPKEAAKLQSFNSDFELSDVDSVSYQQLGNSVNVELLKIFSSELFKLGKA